MSRSTRYAAAIAAGALLAVGGVAVPAASAAPAPDAPDYFADTIPGLRAGSVFTAVTYERLERLLNSDGTYAVLIGGPEDATTAATAAHIDAVAAQYGVDAVYTFDPRLDGADVDIRTSAIPEIAGLYTNLVTSYLNKDTTPEFADGDSDPYLVVYDRSHTAGGVEDRIVASLSGTVDAAALGTDDGASAYRAQVAEVFDAVATGGTADVDTRSQFDFFSQAVNQRHAAQYINPATHGGEILTAADGEEFVLQSITYPELVHLLESDGEHTILFGGTWCHNTRAVVKDVNRAAADAGVETVYVFDLRLDGWSGGQAHIRDTNSALSYLYGDLVAEHFPVLRTQYVTNASAGQRVDYRPGGDATAELKTAQKLQVPYLVRYDKDRGGIVQDWLRDNGNGTVTEYMTEWWWVAGLPGSRPNNVPEAEWPARQATSWAFAAEAIAKIDGFFGLAAAPEAPAAPTATVSGQDITVRWSAPADGGSAITGYRVSLDDAAPVTVAADQRSHVFTGVPAGSHRVSVAAVNHLGASAAVFSQAVTVAEPTTPPGPGTGEEPGAGEEPGTGEEPQLLPSVSVTGDLKPGGSIVVTGAHLAGAARVSVEIHSTPQPLGTAVVAADGTFRLAATIPTATPAGAHAVVVFVDGVEVARTAITVAASPSAALAATGSELPVIWGASALAALVLGAVLVAARRRRAHV
ncbi:fibronectin type III domain-containing protein [Microbacterium sp. NPDC089189]|uniref:fibronectin type III domain-containing protein n=1 Tax=Microbacterium sp. NPDC089189 TaxID=3154972 RepID=UPI00341D44F0